MEKAKGILDAQKSIRESLKDDKDFILTSVHDSPIFSFTSNTVNSIAIGEQMLKRHGWTVAKLQRPAAAHLAITDSSAGNWKHFVSSLKDCVAVMKKDPSLNVNHDTAVYGLTGQIPDKSLLH